MSDVDFSAASACACEAVGHRQTIQENSINAAMRIKSVEIHRSGSASQGQADLSFHADKSEARRQTCTELFDLVRSGKAKVEVSATLPLKEAARAHPEVESRRTIGSVL
jgi:NADPH2:quinone reductase